VKHLILGTAGHVDHGKTALVKALTGIDCDTHKEEKRRGITINLGFTHLSLASGDTVGIVDVPGHRDFVHTMVAGASGIDCVLLVIAADSGVMPQTREHLAICDVLGIRTGIVAVTRVDLVDGASLARVHEEIAGFTKGTFLENSPVVDVSSVTGSGIEPCKAAIAETISRISQRRGAGTVFRMSIDRIFSVSGFGTVVTGSVKSGKLSADQTAYLLPPQKELRVRRIERYGAEVLEVLAGDRASLNLVGLSKEEFVRGMLVSDRPLAPTTLLDVRLRLFDRAQPIARWSQAEFIMDTFEAQARIHLLESDGARPGETVLAQIRVPKKCCAQAQDTFVLRSSSSDTTIGGGEIIDPHPLHHRRRPPHLVTELKQLAQGKLPQLAALEVAKHPKGIDHVSVAAALNISPDDVVSVLRPQPPEGIVALGPAFGAKQYLIAIRHYDALVALTAKSISDFHRANPFSEIGRSTEELQGILAMGGGNDAKQCTDLFLEYCVQKGILKRTGNTFSMPAHSVNISKQEMEQCRAVEEFFKKSGMQTPVRADLVLYARKHSIDEKRLRQLMHFMVSAKTLYTAEGQYLHCSVVDSCRKKLMNELGGNSEGLTVAQFRDLVSGNRKICLLLYALFDSEGIIERKGDVRVMTEKGKKLSC
jgi:selenocysteine-specific elongation factor